MTGASIIPRRIIILALVLPLAGLLGILLATPEDTRTLGIVALVGGLLCLPLILRWHHPMLIFGWNAAIQFAFLPGRPDLWMLMGLISLTVTMINVGLDRTLRLVHVPSITWTLVVLAVVVLVTAKLSGGMAVRAFGGSAYGGKRYFLILLAMIGYFALSTQRVPMAKASLYSGMFVLSRLTVLVSNLAYFFPVMWFLYYFFPVDFVMTQVVEESQGFIAETAKGRLAGVGIGMISAASFMLLRFGVGGLFEMSKPWRLPLFILCTALSLQGGFRSVLVLQMVLFAILFHLEGLWRSRVFPLVAISGIVVFAFLFAFGSRLPLPIQRSISFLPVEINPLVRLDAKASSQWRLEMWRALLPEISTYFWKGKGYTASATDYYLVAESVRRGFARDYESAKLAGDYHSGPLSLIIPFGIWGVLAFGAFLVAALRVLHRNYKHGPPELRRINRFLLAAFAAQMAFFLLIFGDWATDLAKFLGLVGFSVSLNGGVSSPPTEAEVGRSEETA